MTKPDLSSRLRSDVIKTEGDDTEVSLTATAGQLNQAKSRELIEILRRNFLYQAPRPVFDDADDDRPTHLLVRMKTDHYEKMFKLITEAGGWDLPESVKRKLAATGETGAMCKHGNDWRRCRKCLGEKTSRELDVDEKTH